MSNEQSQLAERRQRAREAAQDEIPPTGIDGSGARVVEDAVEAAIETATRVRITDELIDNLADVTYAGGFEARRALVAAALAELGFEVES